MTLPVLLAITGSPWEADLVARLERARPGVTVVRRCVDLPDLLAAAATGVGRAALVSADLRGLDADALSRLTGSGVAVVGLVAPSDEPAEQRLRRLGVAEVLPADTDPTALAGAVTAACAAPPPDGGHAYSRVLGADVGPAAAGTKATAGTSRSVAPDGTAGPAREADPDRTGAIVAVWGPTGAPGRTTVAVGMATALARSGTPTLLADADVYGGVVAQVLGLLDEAPGLAAATRLANAGSLDLRGLARCAPEVLAGLRVLTGLPRPDRWPELRPAALERVWELCRRLADVTVVDCGFAIEQDEELSFDTAAPRRNGATLTTLSVADTVLAVGAADPVGVQRLVRALADLRDVLPEVTPRVVLNRVRRGPVGPDPQRQLRDALDRYAGVRDVLFLPEDRESLDAALLHGRAVTELVPDAPVSRAIAALAATVTGRPAPVRRRRLVARSH